jgi:hypothetical protein
VLPDAALLALAGASGAFGKMRLSDVCNRPEARAPRDRSTPRLERLAAPPARVGGRLTPFSQLRAGSFRSRVSTRGAQHRSCAAPPAAFSTAREALEARPLTPSVAPRPPVRENQGSASPQVPSRRITRRARAPGPPPPRPRQRAPLPLRVEIRSRGPSTGRQGAVFPDPATHPERLPSTGAPSPPARARRGGARHRPQPLSPLSRLPNVCLPCLAFTRKGGTTAAGGSRPRSGWSDVACRFLQSSRFLSTTAASPRPLGSPRRGKIPCGTRAPAALRRSAGLAELSRCQGPARSGVWGAGRRRRSEAPNFYPETWPALPGRRSAGSSTPTRSARTPPVTNSRPRRPEQPDAMSKERCSREPAGGRRTRRLPREGLRLPPSREGGQKPRTRGAFRRQTT